MQQVSFKALLFIAVATFLLIIGVQMSQAQLHWKEKKQTTIEGTKVSYAAVGGVGGGVLGGIAGFLIGGVGVVLCGTGVGIPAGAGMIAAGAAVGAGTGAITGAAVGDSTKVVDVIIDRSAPAYETWQWVAIICIAIVLYAVAVCEFKKTAVTVG